MFASSKPFGRPIRQNGIFSALAVLSDARLCPVYIPKKHMRMHVFLFFLGINVLNKLGILRCLSSMDW